MSEAPRKPESRRRAEDYYVAELKELGPQQRKLAHALLAPSSEQGREALETPDGARLSESEKRKLIHGLRIGGFHGKGTEDIRLAVLFDQIDELFQPERRNPEQDNAACARIEQQLKTQKLQSVYKFLAAYLSPVIDVQTPPPSLDRFFIACPTPVEFFDLVQRQLRHIEQVRPEALPLVAKETHRLQECLYGKKSVYWDQYLLLQRKAFRFPPEQPLPSFSSPRTLSPEEQHRACGLVEVKGGAMTNGPLTRSELLRAGLGPTFAVTVEGKTFLFSSAFSVEERLAVIGYTPTNDRPPRYETRSYYLSSSQNVWRYLPMVNRTDEGKVNGFYKGTNEQDLTVAIPLQVALAQILSKGQRVLSTTQAERAFYGTTCDDQEERGQVEKVWLRAFQHDGRDYIRGHAGQCHAKGKKVDGKFAPEQLGVIDSSESPSFTERVATWTVPNPLYGEVRSDVFLSKNQRLLYVFCRNSQGQIWIAHIENRSGLSPFGGKQFCVHAADLGTPVYEYENQADDYGDPRDRNGKYVNIFKNYHAHIELIQAYQEAVRKESWGRVTPDRHQENTLGLFARIRTFPQLLRALESIPGLQGSRLFYDRETLQRQIIEVWDLARRPEITRTELEAKISKITNAEELRTAVLTAVSSLQKKR